MQKSFRQYFIESISFSDFFKADNIIKILKDNIKELSKNIDNTISGINSTANNGVWITLKRKDHYYGNIEGIFIHTYSYPQDRENNVYIQFKFPSAKDGNFILIGEKLIFPDSIISFSDFRGFITKEIISTISIMINDPEEYVLYKDIKNIQHLHRPTKEQQERIIKELGPRGILLITKPDPELLEKYKNVKILSKAGIF